MIVRIHREFWTYRDAVIFGIFTRKERLIFLAEVFFELEAEFLHRLVKGSAYGILIPDKGGILQGMPEVSDPIFAISVFDKIKQSMAKIVIWRSRKRITGIEIAIPDKIRNAVIERSISDDHG
jgi:hypothetical protein